MYISDCCGATTDTRPEVHVLLGADCVNCFLHEKKEVHGEAAWSTEFGWVLSGPVQSGPEAKQKEVINVANIQADIATL